MSKCIGLAEEVKRFDSDFPPFRSFDPANALDEIIPVGRRISELRSRAVMEGGPSHRGPAPRGGRGRGRVDHAVGSAGATRSEQKLPEVAVAEAAGVEVGPWQRPERTRRW